MSGFSGSPRVLRAGLVLLDPDSFAVLSNGIIVMQYNPETLTRTLKIKGATEGGDRTEALRLTGPPKETIKLDAELDATDQLEHPTSATLQNTYALSQQGVLEIMPLMAPMSLFVWGPTRIVPVRLTDFSISEEAFDPQLNPLRAKVSLGMEVLSIDDLFFSDKGGGLYMAYQHQKESLAQLYQGGTLGALGIRGLP
jgi:hypothetical protein